MKRNEMLSKGISALLLCSLLFAANASQISNALPTTEVRFVDASSLNYNPNNRYFISVLDAALAASENEFGPYLLHPVDIMISQSRQLRELEKGTFNVFWTMTTYARESEALAVNEPLIKGAYGIRLMVVNNHNLAEFSSFSQEQLAALPALSGADWPDTAILRINRFEVNSSRSEQAFYGLLTRDTKQYYPRGIFEARTELNALNRQNLSILTSHIIRYPAVMKFFVSKDNPKLAARLSQGLKIIKKNGEFDKLFYQHPTHMTALSSDDFSGASVINLKNPLLPASVNLDALTREQDELIEKLRHPNK